MNKHTFTFLLLIVVLVEIVEILEAYKPIRPYKYYRPRSRYRSRGRPPPRPLRFHPLRKRPAVAYYPRRRPAFHPRYPSNYDQVVDYGVDEPPYTIEIELPKRHGHFGAYRNDIYHREDDGVVRDYPGDDDYLDDYDDDVGRVIRAGKKKVRIKVLKETKPKLRIKLSRADSDDEVDQLNGTKIDSALKPEILTNLKELDDFPGEEWVPSNPSPSYPAYLRGA